MVAQFRLSGIADNIKAGAGKITAQKAGEFDFLHYLEVPRRAEKLGYATAESQFSASSTSDIVDQ